MFVNWVAARYATTAVLLLYCCATKVTAQKSTHSCGHTANADVVAEHPAPSRLIEIRTRRSLTDACCWCCADYRSRAVEILLAHVLVTWNRGFIAAKLKFQCTLLTCCLTCDVCSSWSSLYHWPSSTAYSVMLSAIGLKARRGATSLPWSAKEYEAI